MTANELKKLRQLVPLSQAGFAQAMGVPLRTYEDLEGGRSVVRPIHLSAAYWAVIKTASRETVAQIVLPDDMRGILAAALANTKPADR